MPGKDKERRRHHDRSRSRSPSSGDERRWSRREREREGRRHPHHDKSWSRSRSPLGSPEERTRRRKGKDLKRHRHQDRSPPSSPNSSRSSSQEERRRAKGKDGDKDRDDRRRQKDLVKALETPEEKRTRRLAKKEAKERTRREKMGWDQEYLGYTNADNPFGDQHLLESFVWHKKRDQQASDLKLSTKGLERREKLRQEETKRELEKVKKRRIEREKEKEAREEEMTMLQRMKEAEMFKEWEGQEDKFHLDQAKLRSKIRIEAGRAKPIDLLAKYANMTEEDMDIEVQEPYHLLRGLNIVDLEDLMEDIAVYCELERVTHLDYWKDMTIVCEDEVQKLKKLERESSGGGGSERRGGINMAVSGDVTAIFKGKTHGELRALEEQIDTKITSADPGTDVSFYESLLQQLKAHMARARLRDRHQAMLRKKLFRLKQEQAEQFGIAGTPLFPSAESGEGVSVEEGEGEVKGEGEGEGEGEDQQQASTSDQPEPSGGTEEPDTLIDEEDLLQKAYDDYDAGAYSPKLLKPADIEEAQVLEEGVDASQRAMNRQKVLSGGKVDEDYSKIEMSRTVDTEGNTEEEYNFNSEVSLEVQNPIWKEKYRPRKPRFFNRVHTGFEWNKYNQTHYDTDNPPPKIVQGYKFNIFYPDLINKRKTPEYRVTPCDDNVDFAILRFHAGPPYEDIGFKVVNREWDFSWKHGFKSQFNNNILQLWFRFKRNRYRR